MRKLLILTMTVFCLSVKASTLGSILIGAVFLGTPTTIAYAHYWHHGNGFSDGCYVSPGLDLKWSSEGLIDMRTKLFIHHKRFEPNIVVEIFPDIRYRSIGIGLDYAVINRKLGFLSGVESSYIENFNGGKLYTALSVGVNGEIRYVINNNTSISYISNVKTRPEISKKYVYSGYINFNFKL